MKLDKSFWCAVFIAYMAMAVQSAPPVKSNSAYSEKNVNAPSITENNNKPETYVNHVSHQVRYDIPGNYASSGTNVDQGGNQNYGYTGAQGNNDEAERLEKVYWYVTNVIDGLMKYASGNPPPPLSGNKPYPPNPGSYPPNPGSYPPNPGTYPPNPGSYPPNSGSYPPNPASYPPNPASYPPNPASYPPNPASYPPNPGSYPPNPASYPPNPASYPPNPASYPPNPASYPPNPASYQPNPGSYLPNPGNYPPNPASYPPNPASYPPNPASYPPNPASYPSNPASYPQSPGSYQQNVGSPSNPGPSTPNNNQPDAGSRPPTPVTSQPIPENYPPIPCGKPNSGSPTPGYPAVTNNNQPNQSNNQPSYLDKPNPWSTPQTPDQLQPNVGSPASGTTAPVTIQANEKTKKLLFWLTNLPSSRKFLSGSFGGFTNVGNSDGFSMLQADGILASTSKSPAVYGLDCARGWDTTTPGKEAELVECASKDAVEYSKRGGLITISHHLPNPFFAGNSNGGKEGAYKQSLTNEQYSEILRKDSPARQRWLSILDKVALGLQDYRDRGISVLYRPFHAMNGDWFWWAAGDNPKDTARMELFKRLWMDTHDYFSNKGLDNLLWVYSPDDSRAYRSAYYPGERYVDIVALSSLSDDLSLAGYEEMVMLNKPFALTEVGPKTINRKFDYGNLVETIAQRFPKTTYFMAWNGQHSPLRNQGAWEAFNNNAVLNVGDFNLSNL